MYTIAHVSDEKSTNITELGKRMSALPVSPACAKMLLLALAHDAAVDAPERTSTSLSSNSGVTSLANEECQSNQLRLLAGVRERVLSYVVLLVATLSVQQVFIDSDLAAPDPDSTPDKQPSKLVSSLLRPSYLCWDSFFSIAYCLAGSVKHVWQTGLTCQTVNYLFLGYIHSSKYIDIFGMFLNLNLLIKL